MNPSLRGDRKQIYSPWHVFINIGKKCSTQEEEAARKLFFSPVFLFRRGKRTKKTFSVETRRSRKSNLFALKKQLKQFQLPLCFLLSFAPTEERNLFFGNSRSWLSRSLCRSNKSAIMIQWKCMFTKNRMHHQAAITSKHTKLNFVVIRIGRIECLLCSVQFDMTFALSQIDNPFNHSSESKWKIPRHNRNQLQLSELVNSDKSRSI